MRSSVVVACSIVALGCVPSAFADGMPGSLTVAPVVEEHYGWSGLYFGAGGGFSSVDRSGHTKTERTKKSEKCPIDKLHNNDCLQNWEHHSTTTTHSNASFDDDEWDAFGTVQVGYDHLFHHHLLIGAFADFDLYDSDGGFHFADGHGSVDLDWAWHVGGRLGTLVTPRVLLYGVGGYTQANLDGAIWIKDGPTLHQDDHLDGWFIGGGTEVKLHQRVSFKLEYRYADYGSSHASGSTSKTGDANDCNHAIVALAAAVHKCRDIETVKSSSDLDLEVQSVRALLVFRLDEEDRVVRPLK